MPPTYVHDSVYRRPETTYGEGSSILADNVEPFVSIGNNCVLWSGNHIGHHSKIGNNVFIASHAVISGRCTIGDNCFVGVNATFRDNISVAEDCVIGAGALLLKERGPCRSLQGGGDRSRGNDAAANCGTSKRSWKSASESFSPTTFPGRAISTSSPALTNSSFSTTCNIRGATGATETKSRRRTGYAGSRSPST